MMRDMSTPWENRSGSEDDEFPDLTTLAHRARQEKATTAPAADKALTVRRRNLLPSADSALLKPWPQTASHLRDGGLPPSATRMAEPTSRRERQSRTVKQFRTPQHVVHGGDRQEDENNAADRTAAEYKAPAKRYIKFRDSISTDSDDSNDWAGGSSLRVPATVLPSSKASPLSDCQGPAPARCSSHSRVVRYKAGDKAGKLQSGEVASLRTSGSVISDADLVGVMNGLSIDEPLHLQRPFSPRGSRSREATTPPPSTPSRLPAGLVSPKKLPRIPVTPHHPSTDLFWSREFVDDWNEEHSPKKQLFPDVSKRMSKQSTSPPKKSTGSKTHAERDAKKAFQEAKHGMAQRFLEELDTAITQGRLSVLAETTGGIKLNWSNRLNTTAGRASWKRETVKTGDPHDTAAPVKYRHHASIELAEKVIDDEHRLLNVIAHEFCHLANFMVTGVTNNPHGKEFKAWAAKCSHVFGDRGIQVTTKHSYDIEFKYIWECTSCALEYKRHSKSINPERHRCGSCKSQLRQTRPVPRSGAAKPSEYQMFMKEQMRLLKQEDPNSPQKEIMKRVAERWTSLQASSKALAEPGKVVVSVDEVDVGIEDLDLDSA